VTHRYTLGGFNIVIDCNSGSIHACDELTSELIALREVNDAERALVLASERFPDISNTELREIITEIDELAANGQLFAPPSDFEPKRSGESQIVKALCLNISHACNLRCSYCFASKATNDNALMSFGVGKAALDFLVANSGSRRNLEVDFFGGEPLLNWDVVKQLVAYARSIELAAKKNFRFTLTTNGVLLDEDVENFANREFTNVVLSLDGRRETHDRFRKTVSGESSYDTVVPKFRQFVKNRVGGYYIRGTYTRENLDFLSDILKMRELGFEHLSIEPVVCSDDEPYALRESDLPVIFEQYEKLAEEMTKREFTFYHYNLDLENGPCLHKRVAGCGSGSEYLAVTPDGTLYPCHQFVGDPKFAMGDVFTGVTKPEIRAGFANRSILTMPECKTCWARLWCAGGCAANSYHATGNIDGTYKLGCELFKKRLECAIFLKFAVNGE
jgi:uncharacterized protein